MAATTKVPILRQLTHIAIQGTRDDPHSYFTASGNSFFTARVAITDIGPHTLVTIDADAAMTIRLDSIAVAATVTQDDFILMA